MKKLGCFSLGGFSIVLIDGFCGDCSSFSIGVCVGGNIWWEGYMGICRVGIWGICLKLFWWGERSCGDEGSFYLYWFVYLGLFFLDVVVCCGWNEEVDVGVVFFGYYGV